MSKKILVIIVGPTAVGKTSLSIELAKIYKSEIVSADSRQFFRELEIGTAKPSPTELSEVKHHFINSHSIHDIYDVGQYEKDVIKVLETAFLTKDHMFLVGGSGLYVNAISNGIDDFPDTEDGIRERLNSAYDEEGIDPLLQELKKLDPVYYEQVDRNNPQRVIRALEVSLSSGQPYSSFRRAAPVYRPFRIIKVGLEMDREVLYERIDSRMDLMINSGLFEEAERFYEHRRLNALQTVGYKEIFGYLNGEYDKQEAIRLLKRNSRRYAKRQLTWFKRDSSTTWFRPDELDQIRAYLDREISEGAVSKD